MIAVKLVFSNGEDDERELGPFNQGVVFKQRDHTAPLSIYDVASDTPIARFFNMIGWCIVEDHRLKDPRYREVFVHAFAPQPLGLHDVPARNRWV